ncbi:hypothetical protein POM88_047043 [Heracleum sosnowskyi]|uniref:Uncharacterized protein n=1 Tax=Heracleum sosnowskyi TaxID=360622 RepID=A0AAD8M7I8_9APIA|nr:hypothetical protein POM88_047043 [Heracleum sosnowskyi]
MIELLFMRTRQKLTFSLGNPGTSTPEVSNSTTLSSLSVFSTVGGTSNSPNNILGAAPPALASFSASLPVVEGGEFETNITRFTLLIRSLAFNKSGTMLATTDDDEGIKLINTIDGSVDHIYGRPAIFPKPVNFATRFFDFFSSVITI